jgi:hypothetical protein
MHLRTLLISCFFALAPLAASAQTSVTWSDPTGRLSFSHPSDWPVNITTSSEPGAVRVFVGPADAECQIWALPKAATASDAPDTVKQRYIRQASDRFWLETVEPLSYFRGGQVRVSNQSVNASGEWPVQHVTLTGSEHQVRGTLTGRPGVEYISLCLSFDSQDRGQIFARIENSIGPATP